MILATHALVGAAIGEKVSNPWLVILLSLIIHFALDTFRHGEYLDQKSKIKNTWWKIALDLSVGSAIIVFYIYTQHPATIIIRNILLGAFVSIFPDGLTLLYWKARANFLKKIIIFHTWLHPFPPFAPERAWTLRNATNDILISLAAIIILFLK